MQPSTLLGFQTIHELVVFQREKLPEGEATRLVLSLCIVHLGNPKYVSLGVSYDWYQDRRKYAFVFCNYVAYMHRTALK